VSDESAIAKALLDGLPSTEGDAAEIAAFLQHPLTLVESVPTRFLRRYGIFRIMPRHLSRPILRHLAGGAGLSTHILGADPADLAGVLRADSSKLDDADEVTSYAEVLLEVESPRPGLTRVVGSFEEIPLKDAPDDEEAAAVSAAQASLGDRIRPPQATRSADGWTVHLWVARDGTLDRDAFRIGAEGAFLGHEVDESHALPTILVA
jgi:hypothetical protein